MNSLSTMNPMVLSLTIVVIVLACIVTIGVVILLFKGDDRIEKRRKAAVAISNQLTKIGLTEFVSLFTDYAVGDYAGFIHEVEALVRDLGSEKKAMALLSELFYDQLDARLADPVERIKVLAEVAKPVADLAAAAAGLSQKLPTEKGNDSAASPVTVNVHPSASAPLASTG